MPVSIATALVRGPDPLPELAVGAVSLACERARVGIPHSVLLFLTGEFARGAHTALAAVARSTQCLNVWGCTAPGVLTENEWSADQPAACALVIGDGMAIAPAGEGTVPQLSLAVPEAATPRWLYEPARYGLISTDSGAQHPGRVWAHGKTQTEGRAAATFGAAEVRIGVARGLRPLGAPEAVEQAAGYDVARLGGHPALTSLMHALPVDMREAPRLPLNQLFAAELTEHGEDAIARGRYRVIPIISVNHDDRSVTLAQPVAAGAQLFWCLRSPDGAEADMHRAIDGLAQELSGAPDFGVVFSCMGRGPYFYGGEDRDLAAVRARFPALPLIGAYGAGQIAPLVDGNSVIQNAVVLSLVRAG